MAPTAWTGEVLAGELRAGDILLDHDGNDEVFVRRVVQDAGQGMELEYPIQQPAALATLRGRRLPGPRQLLSHGAGAARTCQAGPRSWRLLHRFRTATIDWAAASHGQGRNQRSNQAGARTSR